MKQQNLHTGCEQMLEGKFGNRLESFAGVVLPALLAATSLLFHQAVLASPVVTGNIIYLPDEGWHQVQSSETYQTLCEGTQKCVVGDGVYIVINLSTGQRWEGITVNGSSGVNLIPPGNGGLPNSVPLVSGNTISWTDNSWYQVQSSVTYKTFCEGGQSCDVPDGTYNVINLTEGVRFDSITVGEISTSNTLPPTNSESTLNILDNEIRWSDDGWYQVQSALTLETLCEGGVSCTVPDGDYIVINLTSGQRWERVVVSNSSTNPPIVNQLINENNMDEILRNVITFVNEEPFYAFLADLPQPSSSEQNVLFPNESWPGLTGNGTAPIVEPIPDSVDYVDQYVLNLFNCEAGGSLDAYNRIQVSISTYIYNQCIIDGRLINGSYYANAVGREGYSQIFEELSLIEEAGNETVLSGYYRPGYSRVSTRSYSWSDVSYGSTLTQGTTDTGVTSVEDFTSSLRNTSLSPSSYGSTRVLLADGQYSSLETYAVSAQKIADFSITSPWSGQQRLTVSVDLSYSFRSSILLGYGPENVPLVRSVTDFVSEPFYPNLTRPSVFQWNRGNITITSTADNSSLTLTPSPEVSDVFTLQLNGNDATYTRNWNDGFTITRRDVLESTFD